jgi:membrane protein implicated in regulation of membrane protease activity
MNMAGLGRALLLAGGALALLGLLFLGGSRLSWFGHLPGDIHLQSERLSCFFPLATGLLLSLILTVLLNVLLRLFRH